MFDPQYYKPDKGAHLHHMWQNLVVMPGLISPRKWGMKPLLNGLGEPVEIQRSPEQRWIKAENADPVWMALAEKSTKGVFLPIVTRNAEIVTADAQVREMTADEQYQFHKKVGQAMRKELERNLVWFRAAKPAHAKKWMDKRYGRIRKRAILEIGRAAR